MAAEKAQKLVGGDQCLIRAEEWVILRPVIAALRRQYERDRVPPSHGINHALAVMANAARALAHTPHAGARTPRERIIVLLAALLHDADDRKYYPHSVNYANARALLAALQALRDNNILMPDSDMLTEMIIQTISLVSASANGDDKTSCKDWVLIPRYADRVEAIGYIGCVRCWEYSLEAGRPLAVAATPRCTTAEQARALATPERFQAYRAGGGKSASMIDHCYDKLVHLSMCFKSGSEYLDELALRRAQPIIDMCLHYGRTGELPPTLLEEYRKRAAAEAPSDAN